MVVGLVLSLGATLLFGVATVWQAIGVRRRAVVAASLATDIAADVTPDVTADARAADSASALLRLMADRWYVAGSALDFVGAVATAIALQHLPLFIVESCIAASIAVTAVIAVPVLDLRLAPREVAALAVVGLGLALLAISSSSAPARALSGAGLAVLLAGLAAMAGVAVVAWRVLHTRSSIVMAVICGLAFSGMSLAERTLVLPHPWWHLLGQPTIYALLGYGAIGIAAYASAITLGKVTTITAVTFAVETLVPSAIGLLLLGDAPRSGFGPLAVLGFAGTVGGAIALARVAEVA